MNSLPRPLVVPTVGDMRRITIAGAVAVGAALLAAPVVAAAAPAGSPANETIARLQDEGSRVVVNKVGSGTECSVTSVRPMQVRELPRGGQRIGLPIAPLTSVVHVGVQC